MSSLTGKLTRKTWYLIAMVFIILLVAGGIFTALYLYNLREKDLSSVSPDFVITASALLKEFEDDEVAATQKYVGRIIEVTGVVESQKSGENNVTSILLRTDSDLSSVICTLRASETLPDVRQGDTVTIRGVCSGYLMDVLLNNCVFL